MHARIHARTCTARIPHAQRACTHKLLQTRARMHECVRTPTHAHATMHKLACTHCRPPACMPHTSTHGTSNYARTLAHARAHGACEPTYSRTHTWRTHACAPVHACAHGARTPTLAHITHACTRAWRTCARARGTQKRTPTQARQQSRGMQQRAHTHSSTPAPTGPPASIPHASTPTRKQAGKHVKTHAHAHAMPLKPQAGAYSVCAVHAGCVRHPRRR